MPPPIHKEVCGVCGTEASGPDVKDVKAAMARHMAKKHPVKRKGS